MPRYLTLLICLVALAPTVRGATHLQAVPVPAEMRSSSFAVTVNGKPVDVLQAASNYSLVNFDITGPAEIAITATEAGFWDRGVDIEPWRLGLRASRSGQTIRFHIAGPVKLAISRPRDYLNHARMLFLFAGTPPPPAPSGENVTIIPAGIHEGSLNPKSGDTIYLAPGAFVLGSLNLWQVNGVKVLGRGTIVYEGPQDPSGDEGWMQKPDWHCIDAYRATNIEIDGVTCIVRSRTWSIQMKDSTGFRYNDLRVVAGDAGNANQDGMDWLGGGDTVVRDSFFRSSDDDLAILGNFDGYEQEELTRPGDDVKNIVVEDSEFSTSISNIVRIGWPQKIFNSDGFTLRNSDILHGGIGACGQPFALLGMWGAEGSMGQHSNIRFENLFLDNWYSLAQVEQELPAIRGITFRNIWALDQPPITQSTLVGDVADVTIDNLKYGQTRVANAAQIPLSTGGNAEQPIIAPAPPLKAAFTVTPSEISPGAKVNLVADTQAGAEYTWLFGDGTEAKGRHVQHTFHDALGTELDATNGAGRFRVLLHVTDKAGHEDWASQGVIVISQWHNATESNGLTAAGLSWNAYKGEWPSLPDFASLSLADSGESPDLEASAQNLAQWATAWTGFIRVPADGGYTFHLMDRDGARVVIDGAEVTRTGPAFGEVCGSTQNALRYNRGAIGLRAGLHSIRVEALNTTNNEAPRLMWEGPGIQLQDVPPQAYLHAR